MNITKAVAYLSASMALLLASPAQAAWPDQPIKLIVPYAAGGGTDQWARLYAKKLSARLGQPVVVENRPGASTQIGANAVAKAAANGYTLLFTSGTHIQVPALYPNVPYSVTDDFAPIGEVGYTGLVFVAQPTEGVNDVKGFIAQAKKAGRYNLGTYAGGSTGAVFGQYLAKIEDIDMPTIIYKGESAAITDVLGGSVQGGFFSVAAVKPLVQAKKLVAMGTLAKSRSPSFTNVPTMVEQGYTQFDWPGIWLGVFAPAKTPPEIVERLAAESKQVVQDPELVKGYAETDLIASWRGPKEFKEDIHNEMAVWKKLVERLGVKAE
ncbi:MAG: tripartite tricarboxylate transporter substrate-binding protein [Burkholderiales bacterium]